jgi:hypothetical protein
MGMQDNRSSERRTSFRCPVPQLQQEAKLRVGRRNLSVRLANESSGGFAAVVSQDLGVKVGDLLDLLTAAGCFKVRVAHLSPIAAEPGKEPNGEVLLGLQRLGETSSATTNPEDCHVPQPLRATLPRVARGALFALAISMALVAALVVLIRLNHPLVQRLLSWQSANCQAVDKEWMGTGDLWNVANHRT